MTVTAWTLVPVDPPVTRWTLIGDDGSTSAIANDNGLASVVAAMGPPGQAWIAPVENYGGGADASGASNRDAFRAAWDAGVPRVALSSVSYDLATIGTGDADRSRFLGQQPSIVVPDGVDMIDGRGATITTTAGSRGIFNTPHGTWAYPQTASYLASDVAAGDTTLTLEAGQGANWTVGDTLIYKFGSTPGDLPEPIQWGFAEVIAKTGDTITIDRPIPGAFTVASVAAQSYTDMFGGTAYNKTAQKMPITRGFELRDLTMIAAAGTVNHHMLFAYGARDLVVRNCRASNIGSPFFVHYGENVRIENCVSEDNRLTDGGGSPVGYFGRGVSLAEVRNFTVRNLRVKGAEKLAFVEHGSIGNLEGCLFENTGDPATGASYGSDVIAVHATYRSAVTVRDLTITGHGGYALSEIYSPTGYEASIRFEGRLSMTHPAEVNYINLAELRCLLDYNIAGSRERYDFTRPFVWAETVTLSASTTVDIVGPPGVAIAVRVYADATLAGGDVTLLHIRRATSGGYGANRASSLVAGETVTIPLYGGTQGGDLWTYRAEGARITIQTGAGAAGKTLRFEVDYAPDMIAGDSPWINT